MAKHLILALALAASTASAGICNSVGNIYATARLAHADHHPMMNTVGYINKVYSGPSASEGIRAMLVWSVAQAYMDGATGRDGTIGRDLVISECEAQGFDK